MAVTAVDLEIEQGRRYPTGFPIRNASGSGANGADATALTVDLDRDAGRVMTGMDVHGRSVMGSLSSQSSLYFAVEGRLRTAACDPFGTVQYRRLQCRYGL